MEWRSTDTPDDEPAERQDTGGGGEPPAQVVVQKPVGSDAWTPYVLLAVAFVFLFFSQSSKVGFERGHHGYVSSHGAAVAKNLSFSDRFLLFHSANVTEEGKIEYEAYSRFPIFPFAAINAVMACFEPDLSLQIYAARQLMNCFLALAMLFAFRALWIWLQQPFVALAAVFLTFSSYYVLYYADMIFNDTPALFGVTLAAFAAIRSQTSGLTAKQLAFAAIVSVSMGWQPFAVLGAWVLVDLALVLKRRARSFRGIVRRPSFIALGAGVLWGLAVLGLQLANEAMVVGKTIGEIDSVNAIRFRIGAAPVDAYARYTERLEWPAFLSQEAERIVLVFTPATARRVGDNADWIQKTQLLLVVLFAAAAVRIARTRDVPWKPFAVVLALSGLLWTLPMKHFVVFHDFQTIFYIGLPLVTFAGLLLWIPRRLSSVLALVALGMFAINLDVMKREKERGAGRVNSITSDFEKIYLQLPVGSRVYVDGDKHRIGVAYHALDFYLAGRYFAPLSQAEYAVSTEPHYNEERLTSNESVNLFLKR